MTLFYFYGRILQSFTFLWKLKLLLFKLHLNNQIYKNERKRNDVIQPRSQSSSAISDVTSPVKLVGKIGHSDSANMPGYEAGRHRLNDL